jgi:hypothetical protein
MNVHKKPLKNMPNIFCVNSRISRVYGLILLLYQRNTSLMFLIFVIYIELIWLKRFEFIRIMVLKSSKKAI